MSLNYYLSHIFFGNRENLKTNNSEKTTFLQGLLRSCKVMFSILGNKT